MIHDQDRSGWFGASDTGIIMRRWDTDTFYKWWLEKLGIERSTYTNKYMAAGTAYEGRVLDYLGIEKRDRQIRIPKYRIRVNLDGETRDTIHEVKTHKDEYKLSVGHWGQAQVEMFAAKKELVINSYRMTDAEYANFFLPIDPKRLREHPVPYDYHWITRKYLPRIVVLCESLKKGAMPSLKDVPRLVIPEW